ncbi:MAG TPA: alpha-L-arabinofuranosidase C-terminal domain-containing protein [Bryobacteraceae bacterium]|nr:alpha-L-arabinofuranosidase C-terminal domain-containing protein [Bryobacteraceae bacterium]
MKTTRRTFAASGAAAGFFALTQKRALSAVAEERRISVNPDASIATIQPELHGNFAEHLGSCIYGGIWVGRDSKIPNIEGYRKEAVEYLRALGIPVLRWPGGCFADFYHWRQGIGPAAKRPKMVNTSWGGYVEDNSFGTHEFIRFCRLIGSEPYLAVNMGSGTPQEMMEWMEYCNYPSGSTLSDERAANGSPEPFRVKYWGIGNENWGCGGSMRPEEYAQQYRQFATFARAYGGTTPYLIACGPSRNDTDWTRVFFTMMVRGTRRRMPTGYAMHFYQRGTQFATKYTPEAMQEQFRLFRAMEDGIVEQRDLMNQFDPNKAVALILDEWGIWDNMVPEEEKKYGRLWQQITTRCAVGAALGLNIFHRHADKLFMTNIAQTVNVLHSLLLTEGDKCVRTPAYYAFELLKPHRGRTAVRVQNPDDGANGLSVSASRRESELVLTLVNPKHDTPMSANCSIAGRKAVSATARALYHADMNACNTFTAPDVVAPKDHTASVSGSGVRVELPPLSVVTVTARLG